MSKKHFLLIKCVRNFKLSFEALAYIFRRRKGIQTKIPYFFYFLEKFTFVTISSKIEWVSKNGVFFFPVPEKKNTWFETSEWVRFKLFSGKNKKIQRKKIQTSGKKKIQQKTGLKMAFLKKYTISPYFLLKHLQKSWVSGM